MQARTIRERFLDEAARFVRAAGVVPGVGRIALIGSIVTDKPNPKDIDLLVTVSDDADLAPLALCARRLQGRLQGLNHTADVFLADERGNYLGRTCYWRACQPGLRRACDALHCGRRPYLHDDLATITLGAATIAAPLVHLWPDVEQRGHVPADVERLLEALRQIA
jgi:predicted nucleotidyltransferase